MYILGFLFLLGIENTIKYRITAYVMSYTYTIGLPLWSCIFSVTNHKGPDFHRTIIPV